MMKISPMREKVRADRTRNRYGVNTLDPANMAKRMIKIMVKGLKI